MPRPTRTPALSRNGTPAVPLPTIDTTFTLILHNGRALDVRLLACPKASLAQHGETLDGPHWNTRIFGPLAVSLRGACAGWLIGDEETTT